MHRPDTTALSMALVVDTSACPGLGQTGVIQTDTPYKVLSLKDARHNQVTNYINFMVYL